VRPGDAREDYHLREDARAYAAQRRGLPVSDRLETVLRECLRSASPARDLDEAIAGRKDEFGGRDALSRVFERSAGV